MEKRTMLFMAIALMLVSLSFVSAVDVSTCQYLNSADTTYDLIANLTGGTDCLVINASGISINGNGYTIFYAQTDAGEGISGDGYDNIHIYDLNIIQNVTSRIGGSGGIELLHADNILIDNVTMFIDGSISTSNGQGILLYEVVNATINNSYIHTDNNDGEGITVDGGFGFAGDINILNTFVNTSSSDSTSIKLLGANGLVGNVTIENADLYNAGSDVSCIRWDPADFSNSWLNVSGVYCESRGEAFVVSSGDMDVYVRDSEFYGGNSYDDVQIFSAFGHALYFTNVTYNQSKESVGSPSELHRMWYYQAYVNNTGGDPLENANVTAYNVTGGFETNLTTDASGFTMIGSLTEYITVGLTTTYLTPFNVFASASGYPAINHSVNISSTLNFLTDFFSLDSSPPTVNLDYPEEGIYYDYKNNFYFNGTATDPNGVDSCNLWGNWTGTWHLNQTINPITSGVQFFTTQNLTDGIWSYNFECNDTTGSSAYNSTNVTFIVDTTYPIIDPNDIDITTTTGSQTVPFNVTAYSEINCNNSFYSVFKSDGSIEGSLENVSLASCSELNDSFVVSAYATYNLTIYMRDKAGNEDYFTKSFTTVEQTGGLVSGGGGDTIIIREKTSTPAENFTIVTTNMNNVMDMVLAKGSKASRSKTFMIINTGIEPIDVELLCDSSVTLDENQTAILNQSSREDFDICDYVLFEDTVVTVSPNEDSPTLVKVYVNAPENISFGDKYPFNIIGNREIDEYNSQYSKLSVTTRFPMWALVFKHSYIPFQDKVLEDGSEADLTTYPVFWIALLFAFIGFALPVLILRKSFLVTGLLLGFGSFILILILGLIFL